MSGAFYVSYAALWALVVFESLVLVGLVKRVSTEAVDFNKGEEMDYGLTGRQIPEFSVADISGTEVNSKDLIGGTTALLFVSPDCSTCAATLIELEALMAKVEGRVVVVCRAKPDRCVSLASHYNLDDVPVICDDDRKLSDLFQVMAPPTAVLISATGEIERYGQPMSGEEFQKLMTQQDEFARPRADANGNGNGELALHHQSPAEPD